MTKQKQFGLLARVLNQRSRLTYAEARELLPSVVTAELAGQDIDTLYAEVVSAFDGYPDLVKDYDMLYQSMAGFLLDFSMESIPAARLAPTATLDPVSIDMTELQRYFGDDLGVAQNRDFLTRGVLDAVKRFRPGEYGRTKLDIDVLIDQAAEGELFLYSDAAYGAGADLLIAHILVPALAIAIGELLKRYGVLDVNDMRRRLVGQQRLTISGRDLLKYAGASKLKVSREEAESLAGHVIAWVLRELAGDDSPA